MREALLETLRLNKRLLTVAGLLTLLTVGLFVVAGSYQAPAIATAQAKWNDLRRRVAATGRSDVSTVYKQGQIDLAALAERIPLKRQFPRLLGDLMEAASTNGVVAGAMTYKPDTVKGENVLAYGLTMKVSGRYAAVKSFLADLMNMPELVVIDGVNLANSDLYEEDVSMDLHMTIYLREGA